MGYHQTLVVPGSRRVICYHKDRVGNDLTKVLKWCETHHEPVWVYNDASYECPHTRVIEHDDGTHRIIDAPWETA